MKVVVRALPPAFQPGALRMLNIPAALEHVHAARGVESPAALEAGLSCLLPPADLSGLKVAVLLLPSHSKQSRMRNFIKYETLFCLSDTVFKANGLWEY